MQDAAEVHMRAVWDYFDAMEEGDAQGMEDPSFGPFDGCETCCIRETLAGAWPVIQQMVKARGRHE